MRVDYTLYYCTDRTLMVADSLETSVERAILGGCTVVQLREKDVDAGVFYRLALRTKEVTDRYHVPLIINDRVDIAMAVDAAGVHVGQRDLPAKAVRQLIGKEKLLGVSASTVAQATKAVQDGADYLGVGAMFQTATKTDTNDVNMETLQDIRKAVSVPLVVIGGIGMSNAHLFQPMGIDGIAVVSAIAAQEDETKAAAALKKRFLQL